MYRSVASQSKISPLVWRCSSLTMCDKITTLVREQSVFLPGLEQIPCLRLAMVIGPSNIQFTAAEKAKLFK